MKDWTAARNPARYNDQRLMTLVADRLGGAGTESDKKQPPRRVRVTIGERFHGERKRGPGLNEVGVGARETSAWARRGYVFALGTPLVGQILRGVRSTRQSSLPARSSRAVGSCSSAGLRRQSWPWPRTLAFCGGVCDFGPSCGWKNAKGFAASGRVEIDETRTLPRRKERSETLGRSRTRQRVAFATTFTPRPLRPPGGLLEAP
jgi:hypothetical protein